VSCSRIDGVERLTPMADGLLADADFAIKSRCSAKKGYCYEQSDKMGSVQGLGSLPRAQ